MPDLHGKLDIVIDMQREMREDIQEVGEKLNVHIVENEHRVTKLEEKVSLRSKVGGALIALIPSLGVAIYFLLG